MNGIEKITGRIAEDAQKRAQDILADAKVQAQSVVDNYARHAQSLRSDMLAQAEDQVMVLVERMAGAGELEGRKELLRTKQAVLEETFALALKKLRELPGEEYTALLAALLVKAAPAGQGEVIMNPADRSKVGKAVVTAANEMLAKAVAPKLPNEVTDTKAGSILDKVVTGASALLAGTGMLTLSEQTRPIRGGFILSDGDVEVNCAFETLVRPQRSEISGDVADVLFA